MSAFTVLDRVVAATGLDPVAQRLSGTLNRLPVGLRDALHGVWLGHPLHPAVAQLPIGAWFGAAVLDSAAAVSPAGPVRAGLQRSATTLVATGLATVPAAAVPGAADWAQLHPEQQRIGLVHAGANTVATALMAASLLQRRRGRHASGRLLGLAGFTAAGLAAGVGGHLSYRWAAGVNHAEDVAHVTDTSWSALDRLELLPDGKPERREVGGTPVVVVRRGDRVDVLADTCSHLSGPLSEGSLDGSGDDACIVCPWHGSAFRLVDGSVRHGPATAPQPRFDVQIADGLVQARVREPEQDAGRRRLGEVSS
jgi:nitrite reductase/ring-hydroxylating ferredoxin subunit/uncharacterized membrane protein